MTAETKQSYEAAILQQLVGNSKQLAVIGERQAVLEADVSELKQEVKNLGTRLDKVETRLGNLETKVDQIETRLGNLETKVDQIETRLGNLETKVDQIETRLGNLETKVDQIASLITWLKLVIGMLILSIIANLLSTPITQLIHSL